MQATYRFIGVNKTAVSNMLNGNCFPVYAQEFVKAASLRAAILRFHVKSFFNVIPKDERYFRQQLNFYKKQFLEIPECELKKEVSLCLDGTEYFTHLLGGLFSMKSFLDIYSSIIASCIMEKRKTKTFKRGNINGETVSGAKFLKWIKESTKSFEGKDELLAFIEEESRTWITTAVNYRDHLAHKSDLNDYVSLNLTLESLLASAEFPIQDPKMPDGTKVTSFMLDILGNVEDFVFATLKLTPGVSELELLTPGLFCSFDPEEIGKLQ